MIVPPQFEGRCSWEGLPEPVVICQKKNFEREGLPVGISTNLYLWYRDLGNTAKAAISRHDIRDLTRRMADDVETLREEKQK